MTSIIENEEIREALLRLLASGLLLFVIFAINFWKQLKINKMLLYSIMRGLIQLIILASLFVYLFTFSNIFLLFGVLTVMIFFGALTASKRLNEIPNVFKIEIIALGISIYSTMALVSIIDIIPIGNPAFWIPIGGMIAGNSMNISYLAIDRTKTEIINMKNQIEAALCLGTSPQETLMLLEIIPTGLRVSITPSINNVRTLGLVSIPGLMTGLLIGGVHPIAAALYQILIYVLIITSGLMAGTIASVLTVRNLFHKEDENLLI